ncbi:MAG: ATP-binding protein [Dehalococcoidia bacterium]|jgi:DNA helicase HerA-like ATPase|nr:MAG: hypothetical protein DK305_000964 [Chloroflexota bacterium]|tara:strand:+ start:1593 stop:3299 length:1707 start_codon:yes stop_codon:yes gene_type:complete
MNGQKPIGLVAGIERLASNPLDFWVYINHDQNVQLDDIVFLETTDSNGEIRQIYGMIDEMNKTLEGTEFASDASLFPSILPANLAEIAHVAVLRIEPQIYNPPTPGTPVLHATESNFATALYLDKMENKFVLGNTREGLSKQEIIYGNLDFLTGESGAHVNISGISGVATKTSYAMFLLRSVFSTEALGSQATNAHAIIFNVKGEDLMWLDQKTSNKNFNDNSKKIYKTMDIESEPFSNIEFYAKPNRNDKGNTAGSKKDAKRLQWSIKDFCKKEYIRLLFTSEDFQKTQIEYIVDVVAKKLNDQNPQSAVSTEVSQCKDIWALIDIIEKHVQIDDNGVNGDWIPSGYNNEASIGAFMRRLFSRARYIADMIFSNGTDQSGVNWSNKNFTVIDIHQLHGHAQRFVVGIMLRDIIETREKTDPGAKNSPIFIVLDELNKFAPKDSSSAIKEFLVDIAERGRSMNIILIGAQQTASEVEPRIVSNSAFRVVGRLDAAESTKNEYGYLSQAAKTRTKLLQPGTMIVTQPQIPIPVLLQFPFPAWATKNSDISRNSSEKPSFQQLKDQDKEY